MKQLVLLFITSLLLTSCNERIVQLPETTNKDITEIVDVSPVYMFYDEEKDSVEFNRRNMITATNWLVNIDKRLTLKQILPHLQYLQEKRQGAEKHSFHNYFTCNNTDLKNLSFIMFTNVIYHEESPEGYFSKISDISKSEAITFHINSSGEISTMIVKNDEPSPLILEWDNLLNSIKQIVSESLEPIDVYVSYDSKLTFQDYINFKTKFLELGDNYDLISNHEFIYN